jgi:hypothetical protein
MQIDSFKNDILRSINSLSVYIPEDIVSAEYRNLITYYRIEGVALTVETDFGRWETIAIASTREGMFYRIMNELLRKTSMKLELISRDIEKKKWRYVRADAVDGHWTYQENNDYCYNTIYDSRKLWFEYHIKFVAELFSISKTTALISSYTKLLNKWFEDQHWVFDEVSMAFIENSMSMEIDGQGIEHPQKHEIIT